jgi:cystathionine gamma-synthase
VSELAVLLWTCSFVAFTLINMPMILTAQQAGERSQKLAQQRLDTFSRSLSLDTVLAHAGVSNASHNAPLSPPLQFATTYTRPADGIYHAGDSKYTRFDNPTRLLFEIEMTRLELHGNTNTRESGNTNMNYSCAFASGMMAVSAIILAHQAPLTVLIPSDLYHGVPTVLDEVFSRFQVTTKRVSMQSIESELQNNLPSNNDIIVWMESPSNPQTQVTDIAFVCNLVKTMSVGARITTVVDTTLAPFQRPLLLGADFVVQSATKYIGGHSDVLCGVVTVHPLRIHDLLPKLRTVQVSLGGVASPMDCWLALRGMRTLAIRFDRQCQSALQLAQYLEAQPSVSKVYYPGLESHSQHILAMKQMGGRSGGVLSVEMETEAHAMAFAGALQVLTRATSLGGTETLIEHRASIEPKGKAVSPPGLLRISLGLEDVNDLIDDVKQALAIMEEVCTGQQE